MRIGKAFFGTMIQEEHKEDTGTSGHGNAPTDTTTNVVDITTASEENQQPAITQTPDEDFDARFNARIFELAKEKGREISAIDELFVTKEVEVIKEIEKNPYENLDPKVKGFLDYHKETNRSYDDYNALQKDISSVPDIELARERVRQETGQKLSNEEVDAYLEKKLNVDLSDLEELDVADRIELSAFAKSTRDSKIAEQEKYKQPIEQTPIPTQPLSKDMIQLENGEVMPKEVYEKLVATRQNYIDGITKGAENITQAAFNVKVDDNGSDKTINYGYDYSAEDKQNMLSNASDLEQTLNRVFKTETGEFNHAELAEGMFWLEKNSREKAISAIIHKVRAEVTADLLKEQGNVNFGQRDVRNNIPGNYNSEKGEQRSTGFGVKINL